LRQIVALTALVLALGLLAAGCGGDDEETPLATTTPTGLSGVSGATGTTGASGDISQIEQTLEDAGYTVEKGDPSSRVVTLESGEVEAEEKLDVSGNDLAGTAFVLSFGDESEAMDVLENYETEGTFAAEQTGTTVFAAPEESDVKTLVSAVGA
jgi:ABC-type Fe3+-hydroxamate transport system substrate-binding protein